MGNATFDAVTLEPRVRLAVDQTEVRERAAAIPWYVWCLAAAATCDPIGGYWDISWHISIGRDTFWTPAHMMIYMAGVLAGIACGYAILSTTFGRSDESKAASVSIWGFRGPLGCFIATWGAFAMLTSAPFDNWWHSAYGLDVKIVSLPHSMLAAGELMISLGAIILVCAQMNRSSGSLRSNLNWLLLYLGGLQAFGGALFALESTNIAFMHSSQFYSSVAGLSILMVAVMCVSDSRFPATAMASVYTVLFLAGLWIFPLFAAAPKLGPVYQHITHFVPLWFPVLLIAPAFALDGLRWALGKRWGTWRSAVPAGVVFLGVFAAAQWPFADFLISPMARNRIFGTIYFAYMDRANVLYNPYHFVDLDKTPSGFMIGMFAAMVLSIVYCSLGMVLGNWLRRVQR